MSIFRRRALAETAAIIPAATLGATPPIQLGAAGATFRGIGANAKPANVKDDDAKGPNADEDEMNGGGKPEKDAKGKEPDEENDDDSEGDDECDEEEMRKPKSRACAARHRERARISTILMSAEAGANPELALHMALNTDFGRDKVIAVLGAAPPRAASSSLSTRMSGLANQHVAQPGPTPTADAKVDASWDRVTAKVAVTEKNLRRAG